MAVHAQYLRDGERFTTPRGAKAPNAEGYAVVGEQVFIADRDDDLVPTFDEHGWLVVPTVTPDGAAEHVLLPPDRLFVEPVAI